MSPRCEGKGFSCRLKYRPKLTFENHDSASIINITVTFNCQMLKHIVYVSLLVVLVAASGCSKPEGEGGTSAIYGRVFARDYNSSGVFQGEFYSPDEEVFIIYGEDDNYYDDTYKTSFDGSFRFQYLRPGTYRVFVYSDCLSCPSGIEEMVQTVVISKNNEDIVLADFEIRK